MIWSGYATTSPANDRRQRGDSLSMSCTRLRASAPFQTVDALDASKVFANSCWMRPFLAVYEVREEEVQILRILHGARQWPPS
jgi:plasmid stabilization system protein ParE